jgi:uncharacterized membrane protein (UPF0127 family)
MGASSLSKLYTGIAQRAVLVAFLALVFQFATAVAFTEGAVAQTMRRDTLTIKTAKGEAKIDIEVAETPEQQQRGLMFRRSLPENYGMLFPYDPPRVITMWMKNTYVSLDMVFIRADGRVHRIEYSATPHSEETISSNAACAAVLELPAGAAERYGIQPGDQVVYSLFKTN